MIKGCKVKLQCQLSRFALFEMVFICVICVRFFFEPNLWPPQHTPVFFVRWGENVVVLCMTTVKIKPTLPYVSLFAGKESVYKRAARAVAIYYHLKYVSI